MSDGRTVPELLANSWDHWAHRCRALTGEEWSTPTRRPPWDVAVLTAHLAPDPAMFDLIEAAVITGEPAVADAAGGEPLPDPVIRHTRDVLSRIADPIAAIEVLSGRAPVDTVFPVLR